MKQPHPSRAGRRCWSVAALAISLYISLPLTAARGGPLPSLGADPSDVGLALNGTGNTFAPPGGPSSWPAPGSRQVDVNLNASNCRQLVDAGFSGQCAVASGPGGSVVGIVEHEASLAYNLVWERRGNRWWFVQRRQFHRADDLGIVASEPIGPGRRSELIFVTGTARPGFGGELDVVDETGQVVLYRYLGQGFVVATADGSLVQYRADSTEQGAPANAYDQLLIRATSTGWRAVAQQYVPAGAAQAQHHGLFWVT